MEIEDEETSKGVLTEKEARSSSGSSHQGGGPNQIRAHLGFQDQSIIKLVTRVHPGSIFDDPHMDGKCDNPDFSGNQKYELFKTFHANV